MERELQKVNLSKNDTDSIKHLNFIKKIKMHIIQDFVISNISLSLLINGYN